MRARNGNLELSLHQAAKVLRSRRTNLWLPRPPEFLSPLWQQVRTHPRQKPETLSFERTYTSLSRSAGNAR